jgi:hypothetical protein
MHRSCSLLFLLAGIASAADFTVVGIKDDKATLVTSRPIEKLISSSGYYLEKHKGEMPKLIPIEFDTSPPSPSQQSIAINFTCKNSKGDVFALDPQKGNANCGVTAVPQNDEREVFLQLSVKFRGKDKPEDETVSVTYKRPVLDLDMFGQDRELYLMLEDNIKQTLRDSYHDNVENITVTLKFDEEDTAPEYHLRVLDARLSGADEPNEGNNANAFIKFTLSGLLPSRPKSYKITLSLDKQYFSQQIQDLLDEGAEAVEVTTKMEASATPARDTANFFLDATFTSTVNQFNPSKPVSDTNNGQRRNVGLFGLSVAPETRQWIKGLQNDQGGMHQSTLKPYLKADVSTLPLREAEVPTQIADGLDFAYTYGRQGRPQLRGVVLTAGGRHESDRDFKFQIATGRFTATPLIRAFSQSRAYRDRIVKNRKDPKKQGKPFLVTSYSFTPKVGYEFGDVVRDRPGRLLENIAFQDKISRFLAEASFAIEFKRVVTLSATDTYYYHWSVDRRPQRNYVEAKIDFNTGYLFRRFGSRGLASGITAKFQRGEQSPTFKVVNVFSVGVTFVR